ncbi:MAG TPA: hypothetical protein VK595_02375, partial [Vicinamibacterales bacterium]|nr:hypothetical protein [Vicinamibacterales bacterium]
MTQAPGAGPAQLPNRATLLQLQREAVSLLNQAARAEASAEDVRRALLDASQRIEALGAEPEPPGASEAANA